MTHEFELVMQGPNIREEFDEEYLLWCKAVMTYCKETQNLSTTIQNIIKRTRLFFILLRVCLCVCLYVYIHLVGDDMLITSSMWCLGLLLIPIKMKPSDGDIPFLIKFVPVSRNLIMQNIMINICRMKHLHQRSWTRITTNPMWLCLKGISTVNTSF